ncbi:MAG: hypothetical protein WCG44_01550 [bacterium]
MPKKKTSKKKVVTPVSSTMVMRNQFFGMLVLAIGIGALIVMVRYFIISLQVPTDVYLIQPGDLIPGEMLK